MNALIILLLMSCITLEAAEQKTQTSKRYVWNDTSDPEMSVAVGTKEYSGGGLPDAIIFPPQSLSIFGRCEESAAAIIQANHVRRIYPGTKINWCSKDKNVLWVKHDRGHYTGLGAEAITLAKATEIINKRKQLLAQQAFKNKV